MSDQEIEKILIEHFGHKPDSIIELDGGLSNKSWLVIIAGESYVLRYFSEASHLPVCRLTELESLKQFETIVPELVAYSHKYMLYQYIDGKVLTNQDLVTTSLGAVCRQLRLLHTSTVKLPRVEAPEFSLLEIANLARRLPGYAEIEQTIEPLLQRSEFKHSQPLVPCHFDPLPSNWIMGRHGRLILIDWEYARMSVALIDLATLSEDLLDQGLFKCEQSYRDFVELILTSYGDPEVKFDHLSEWLFFPNLYWGIWGWIKSKTSSLPVDFATVSHRRLVRAKILLDRT